MHQWGNFLKLVFLGFISIAFTACDVGFKDDKKDDEVLKEANKIFNEYSRVQGLYQGVLNMSVDGRVNPVDIEIRLNPKVTYEGRAGGELVPQVSLEGTLEVLRFTWPYNSIYYVGRYWYAQDGRIQMSQGPGSEDFGLRFQAYPKDNQLVQGQVWSSQGLVGDFEATLITRDVKTPGEGKEEEERRRYEEAYRDLLGVFVGRINNPTDPEKHRRDLLLRFRFFLQGKSIEATVDNPNTEFDTPRALQVIEYRPDTGAIQIRGEAQGGGVGRVPGYGRFYGRGFLRQGVLQFVEISDHLGPLGEYTGQKQPE
jgi:hypothetical protein